MTRTEFVNEIFEKLEKNHIYLFHHITKEDFEKHKQLFLLNVNQLDDIHFEAGILKLFALFKDAHTMYNGVTFNHVDANIVLIEKDFYIHNGKVFKKIEKINGVKIDEVVEKFKEIIPYEVETWAYSCIQKNYITSPKAFSMIDCGRNDDSILYTCEGNEEVFAKLPLEGDIKKQQIKPFYERELLSNNDILYIRYRRCRDMEGYSFEEFMSDVKKSCKRLPKACLLDVRYNVGGNDIIINPLVKWLKDNKIKTYLLMNESTFSSGTFVVGNFKKNLDATLLGTDAGQPTICYGNIRPLEVDGKKFFYCTRYFELTSCHDNNAPVQFFVLEKGSKEDLEYFDYVGIIKPDIKIVQEIHDLNQGIDTQLEKSLKIIEKSLKIIQNSKSK